MLWVYMHNAACHIVIYIYICISILWSRACRNRNFVLVRPRVFSYLCAKVTSESFHEDVSNHFHASGQCSTCSLETGHTILSSYWAEGSPAVQSEAQRSRDYIRKCLPKQTSCAGSRHLMLKNHFRGHWRPEPIRSIFGGDRARSLSGKISCNCGSDGGSQRSSRYRSPPEEASAIWATAAPRIFVSWRTRVFKQRPHLHIRCK